jgi:hypothetical protein
MLESLNMLESSPRIRANGTDSVLGLPYDVILSMTTGLETETSRCSLSEFFRDGGDQPHGVPHTGVPVDLGELLAEGWEVEAPVHGRHRVGWMCVDYGTSMLRILEQEPMHVKLSRGGCMAGDSQRPGHDGETHHVFGVDDGLAPSTRGDVDHVLSATTERGVAIPCGDPVAGVEFTHNVSDCCDHRSTLSADVLWLIMLIVPSHYSLTTPFIGRIPFKGGEDSPKGTPYIPLR